MQIGAGLTLISEIPMNLSGFVTYFTEGNSPVPDII